MELTIQLRGLITSCNYDCAYCPFAKARDSAETLAADAVAVRRFVAWVASRPATDRLQILVTPWGEGLIRRHYQEALVALSHLPQVVRVAIQTNLSHAPTWAAAADPRRLALWCTYHPTQIRAEAFRERLAVLDALGVAYSVGMVGVPAELEAIEAMRRALRPEVYLWVNALKAGPPPWYTPEQHARLVAVDPLFDLNATRHPSLGRACIAGERAISVDAYGIVRRCNFVAAPLGNLYDPGFEASLQERPCPNATCGCYIGYMHLVALDLPRLYGDGLVARIAPPAARGQR